MNSITHLSNELIDAILQHDDVSIKDIVNFSLTCKRFLIVVGDNNLLWRKKLYHKWPRLKKLYKKRVQNKEDINFKNEIEVGIRCRNKLKGFLSQMSVMFFHKKEADIDLTFLDTLFFPTLSVHAINYYFLVDELLDILSLSSKLCDNNLTYQYYGRKILPYIHQYYLKNIWEEFINRPKEQQLLEEAAFIGSQWYQPQKLIFYFEVEEMLDEIKEQVLRSLKNIHSNHPIFSTSAEQISSWKYKNINDNQWNMDDEKQILDVLRTVLFDKLRFCNYQYTANTKPMAEYILIDCVLKSKIGTVISLAIVFQSVARRLGVLCNLVCLPTHFFLSWKPKYDIENPKNEKYFYIDVLQGGFIRSRQDCPRTRGRRCPIESFNEHKDISSKEMILRMIRCLHMVQSNDQHYRDRTLQIRSLLEFQYVIEPYNIDAIQALGYHYSNSHINLSDIIAKLHELLDNYNDETSVEVRRVKTLLNIFEPYMEKEPEQSSSKHIVAKTRLRNMKYAVGMLVTCHENFNYINGVIIGWDSRCDWQVISSRIYRNIPDYYHMPFFSRSSLDQPHYVILTRNDIYYAAEETLSRAQQTLIEHKEIGRYFSKFALSHYVPNEILTRYFPYDIAVLNEL